MPIRKVDRDAVILVTAVTCKSMDHNPPRSTEHLEPGLWEHSCPACGKVEFFTVDARLRRG